MFKGNLHGPSGMFLGSPRRSVGGQYLYIRGGGGKINSFLEPITLDAHRCHYTQARWRKIPITLKPSMSAMAWFRKLTGPVLPKNR